MQRDAAAHDRELAAEDRAQAAHDRSVAAAELAAEGIDDLTGAMLRRVGLGAIQREMDRTKRSGEALVVAYIDVDGLKAVNDTAGHMAGDALLSSVADSISHDLRSYDVICRFGGDEFLCSLTGQDAGGARERFQQIGGAALPRHERCDDQRGIRRTDGGRHGGSARRPGRRQADRDASGAHLATARVKAAVRTRPSCLNWKNRRYRPCRRELGGEADRGRRCRRRGGCGGSRGRPRAARRGGRRRRGKARCGPAHR